MPAQPLNTSTVKGHATAAKAKAKAPTKSQAPAKAVATRGGRKKGIVLLTH